MTLLVGKPAPRFTAKAVVNGKIVNDFTLEKYLGKNIVFFFYPLDFTFVCPTEIHAFQDRIEEFQKRDTIVVGCSVDSCHSHLAWLRTPRNKGGIEGVQYPLVSDINKDVAKSFQVLNVEEGIAYRGLFIIDCQGIIRRQEVNELALGRNVDEVLRTLDALLFFQQNGEVCPANWKEGNKTMKPTQEGLEHYFAQM